MQNPELADVRADIAKERSANPQDRTERLVGEADYKARLKRIVAAERAARMAKLGVWSEAMRTERRAGGVR